ncbi:unnamed protein product [Anisakis simplex]|uniref:Paramyosin n=1 Tax=Anisakis simplex TaxID=6269 RepID=A0A3P6QZY1_ANISI|nr:unnamed protein product [Anisakis simplex]
MADAKETIGALTASNGQLSAMKRKLEVDMDVSSLLLLKCLQQLHAEISEALSDLKNTDDRCKKAMMDASRLAEELRAEQEHSQNLDRQKKGFELQIKEMQSHLDEAEASAMKGGKRILAKLDQRVRELESELAEECRRHGETQKTLRNKDRRVRELAFQVDEDKKAAERMYDLVEKLQGKIKTYKRQVEEAEELANQNLAKYRQLQHMLEDAEERADIAENSLSKMRAKSRSGSMIGKGLSHSVRSYHHKICKFIMFIMEKRNVEPQIFTLTLL